MKTARMERHPAFALMKQGDVVSFFHMQMPRWLFSDNRYKGLPLEAKVAYTFLLNRFQLSRLNGWVNDAGEVFVIFTRESLAEEMQISYRKAIECFKELAKAELIWEQRLGRGSANRIYLAAVSFAEQENASNTSAPFLDPSPILVSPRPADSAHQKPGSAGQDLQKEQVKNGFSRRSRPANTAHPDLPKPHPSQIDLKDTDRSYIDPNQSIGMDTEELELAQIIEGGELEIFPEESAGAFRLAIRSLFYNTEFRHKGKVVPLQDIRRLLHRLTPEDLAEIFDRIARDPPKRIRNHIAYLAAAIYNAISKPKAAELSEWGLLQNLPQEGERCT